MHEDRMLFVLYNLGCLWLLETWCLLSFVLSCYIEMSFEILQLFHGTQGVQGGENFASTKRELVKGSGGVGMAVAITK